MPEATDGLEHTWDGLPISQEPPYGAAVVVWKHQDGANLFLVLHRKHMGPDFAGDWAWGSPAGCRLPGEPIDRCGSRELREEAGLTLRCIRTNFGTEDWPVYHAQAPADAEVVLSDEHDQYRWLPAAEAAALCLPELVGAQILAVADFIGDLERVL